MSDNKQKVTVKVAGSDLQLSKEKKRSEKLSFKTIAGKKGFKYSSFSVILILIVIALVVGVNVIVNQLPTTATKFDMSEQKYLNLSDDTLNFVSTVDEDVYVYLLTVTGSEDQTLESVLARYRDINPRIHVQNIDIVLHPSFTTQYTNEKITTNSLLFVSDSRSKYVDYYEIYTGGIDYEKYYAGESNYYTYVYNGENLITGAISYVTASQLPKAYVLTGHEELDLPEEFTQSLSNSNVEMNAGFSIIAEGKIPDDCETLIVYAPAKDISPDERDIILDYLKGGGNLLLFTNYETMELPNLFEVLDYYGMDPIKGLACEAQNYYYQQPNLIISQQNKSSDIAADIVNDNKYNMLYNAHGIAVQEDVRSSLTVDPFLYSSDGAYVKVNYESVDSLYVKADEDHAGPVNFACGAVETYGGETTHVVWYATPEMLNKNADTLVSYGNSELVLDSVEWMSSNIGVTFNIASTTMQTSSTINLNSTASTGWMIVLIAVPVIVLVAGLIYWIRRRLS